MSLQTIEFDLQITPGSIPPVLHLAQYDSGRKFYANLKNGSAAFYPTAGSTAKIKGFNAAGVAWEQEATIFNNTVSFAPAGAATDQFGVMPVTIEITHDGETLTPLLMIFDIQRAGYTNEQAVRSPEFETAVEAAVAEALTVVGILLAANQATKTVAMTQPVGVDANGKLWTTPGGGGSNRLVVSLNSSNVPDVSSGDIYSAWQAGYIITLRSSIGIEYDLQYCDAQKATFSTTINGTTMVIVDGYDIEGSTATHYALNGYVKPPGGIPESDLESAVQNKLPFTVTFSISGSTPSCNKTFSQISTAISEGKLICPKFEDSDGFLSHADMLEVQCWFVSEVNGVPTWLIFSIDDTDTVTLVQRPIGNSLDPTTVNITGTTPTITAQNNTIYACGELSTLTINDSMKNISFSVDFTSGSTATAITVPSGYKAPGGDLAPEANQSYELSVRNGKAVLTPFEAVSAS